MRQPRNWMRMWMGVRIPSCFPDSQKLFLLDRVDLHPRATLLLLEGFLAAARAELAGVVSGIFCGKSQTKPTQNSNPCRLGPNLHVYGV